MNLNIPKIITRSSYTALLSEKSKLQAQIDTLLGENKVLKEAAKTAVTGDFVSKADHDAALANLKTETDQAHTVAVGAIKAEYDKRISDLEAQLAAANAATAKAEVSTEEKAIAQLATIGVPVDELPKVSTEEQTPEALFKKWQSLKASDSKAAAEFYSLNRSTLVKYVGLRTAK